MSLLDRLHKLGALRTLDHALAQSLHRLDQARGIDTPDVVLAGAAMASLAVDHGHAAFDLQQPLVLVDAELVWPEREPWLQALRDSDWVASDCDADAAAAAAPLVLEHGLLYLRRYREYERRLAHGLRRLASATIDRGEPQALAPLFNALFPASAGDDGGQARAAVLATLRGLLLITGGPGTGKTTTIARVLLLLIAQAQHAGRAPLRIALAAPTGRAAERMAESLRAAASQMRALPDIDAALCDALPLEARTLHRLLGTLPDRPQFRHHAGHPLAFDVIVVDEASMVDLPLMCKLVEAVPDGARLIMLGDRDQLPSVEAGNVLAAMGDAAGDDDVRDASVAAQLAALRGTLPASPTAAFSPQGDLFAAPLLPVATASSNVHGALVGHRVALRRAYRQADSLQLAPLAQAVRDGDADTALTLLQSAQLSGVHHHPSLSDPLGAATRETLLAPWRELMRLQDPAEALSQAGRLRVLTALREGPQGAAPLNARIEEALAGNQRAPYFHGRLLLITENSYRHGLFNGDIGVCLRSQIAGESHTLAWFAGGDQGVRAFHPAALPAHTGAFAMTVHKAQGSEFDNVWLLLPRQDARTLSRELVYTALTRARRELHVCASDEVLRGALLRHAQRVSGLALRLRD